MRTQPTPARSRSAVALTLALMALAGCTSDDEPNLRVEAAQVEEVPATALDVDSNAEIGLPTGVLTLGVASDIDSVSTSSGSLTPASDVDLVGITWSFEPLPGSDAKDVMLNGQDPQSLPSPTVVLLDGSDELSVPVVAQAGASGGAVIGATDPVGLEVGYDGVTQTVDLDTGAVGAGQAEGLGDLSDATSAVLRACSARDFPTAAVLDHGCRVEAVHRLPYIEGLGWAPDSQTWLVVDARIEGEATMLLGDDPGTPLTSTSQSVQRVAYAVAGDSPRTVNFDFGPPIGAIAVSLDD